MAGAFSDLKEGAIIKLPILQLHPLQYDVGKAQAEDRREEFENMSVQQLKDYLKAHPVPVVIGPDGKTPYILDMHHRAVAAYGAEATDMVLYKKATEILLKHGERAMYAKVVENDSHMDITQFKNRLVEKHWVYLYSKGRLRSFAGLPHDIRGMGDDAYRSLVGFEEKKGWNTKKKDKVFFEQFEIAKWLRKKLGLSEAKVNEELKPANRQKFLDRIERVMKSRQAASEPWYVGDYDCITNGVKQSLK